MKRISRISLLALFLALTSVALLASAGGPVTGKTGASDPLPGVGVTYTAVANTHPLQTAHVEIHTFSMYSLPVGHQGSGSATLDPFGRSAVFGGANFTYPDWRGTVDIESDLPLATVSQIIWSDGNSGDGTTAGAFTGVLETSSELFFPFVVYDPNLQYTRLLIMNLGEEETALRFQYFNNEDGNLDHEIDTDVLIGYPITATGWAENPNFVPDANLLQPFEARIYDMHIPGTVVPNLTGDTGDAWGGSVRVVSLDGQGLAGVATNHWSAKGAMAYNALISGADQSFVPSMERRPSDGSLGFSVIRIQCIESDGDNDCDVDVDLIESATGQVTQRTCEITQHATKGVNTKLLPNDDCTGDSLPGGNWIGSARIQTSDGSLVGVVAMTIREQSAKSHGSTGASSANAGTNVYAPDVYKKGTCGGSWTQWSVVSVQNVGNTTATNVSLRFRGRQLPGESHLPDKSINIGSIAPGGVARYNTKVNCSALSALGNDWEGSLRVVSNQQPVAVVAKTLWQDKMSAYNGVPYP